MPDVTPWASQKLRVLIVDDEPLARAGLRRMLGAYDWLDCIGVAADGAQAIALIDTLLPDLVFLDIQMPLISGLEVVAQITHQPRIVFTTAHAEHALSAFELGALDYLLKPFAQTRLQQSLERLRITLDLTLAPTKSHSTAERLRALWPHQPLARIYVRSGRALLPILLTDVESFEASGDYVAMHIRGARAPHLLNLSLRHLELRLAPDSFVRIHRSQLVNASQIRRYRWLADGSVLAELLSGRELSVSRTMSKKLRLQSWF
jgi:two-component system, LytTR family, response regulator